MTDATVTAPVPQAAPPQAKAGPGTRAYLLAGCSVGGTLCASLASATDINLIFAILSAAFGGIIILVTAAPGVSAAAAPAAATAAARAPVSPGDIAPVASTSRPSGTGAVGIGVAAAVLTFIMNQIVQVAVGFTGYGVAGVELTPDEQFILASIMGVSITIVLVPFGLLIGAYLVSHARNIFAALGIFLLTYLGCYLMEQSISAAFGASGLHLTAQLAGAEAVLVGFVWVLGIPLISLAVGAFGARLAAWLTRRSA